MSAGRRDRETARQRQTDRQTEVEVGGGEEEWMQGQVDMSGEDTKGLMKQEKKAGACVCVLNCHGRS